MNRKSPLDGKKILIVDDEPDVLEVLSQLLNMCYIEKASNFSDAVQMLSKQTFDFAILDIMGVNGFELLNIANRKNIIAVMLTAHALTPENIVRSYEDGAASFLPKPETIRIATFLEDIVEAREKSRDPW